MRSQIKRRLSQPDAVKLIRQLIEEDDGMHRTELADRLCDRFEFYDAKGRRQRSSCLKALRTLEAKGYFVLPPPQTKTGRGSPRRLGVQVPPPTQVPGLPLYSP